MPPHTKTAQDLQEGDVLITEPCSDGVKLQRTVCSATIEDTRWGRAVVVECANGTSAIFDRTAMVQVIETTPAETPALSRP